MVLKQRVHYTVTLQLEKTGGCCDWVMKSCFHCDSDCWFWNKWDCCDTADGVGARRHHCYCKLQNKIFHHIDISMGRQSKTYSMFYLSL